MGDLVMYSLRSLWARRTSTLATVAAIALLVFVLSASRMLSTGMRETISTAGSPDQAMIMEKNAWSEPMSRMNSSVMAEAQAAPGLRLDASGNPLVTAEVVAHRLMPRVDDPDRISTIMIRGVSDNVFSLRPEARIVEGRALKSATDEAIVGQQLVGRYRGLALGDTLELSATRSVRVVGVFETGGSSYESEVWVDIETARSALDMSAVLSSVTAQLQAPEALDTFANPLVADEKKEIAVQRESAYYQKVSGGVSDVVFAIGLVETLIFSLGAILGATLTMYTSVAQRRQEIGVLRALGFSGFQVLWAFLVEAVALSLAAALLGVGVALLTPVLDFRTINFATGQEVSFRFVPTLQILGTSVLVAAAVGLLGGFLPALRAARVLPIAALRA